MGDFAALTAGYGGTVWHGMTYKFSAGFDNEWRTWDGYLVSGALDWPR